MTLKFYDRWEPKEILKRYTKEDLVEYCRKHNIQGFSTLNKPQILKLIIRHRAKNYKGCHHKFDGHHSVDFSSGIVHVVYRCKKCKKSFALAVGETYPPNFMGEFAPPLKKYLNK
jgi:hypothetical protein